MWKSALGVLILIMSCVGPQAQQTDAPKTVVINLHWISDPNGCKIWDSMPAAGETVGWTGTCTDGYADGKGTLTWSIDGRPHSTYEGDMQAGHYAGHGVQVWPTGARYDGEWKNDRADGQGTYRSPTGEVCAGAWVNGCFKGGKCTRAVGASWCAP